MTGKTLDLDAIKATADFESVLVHYRIALPGQGAQRQIRCPFHDDRTPSCSINLDAKLFHCFGCGREGSILDFVAALEGCTIGEAARRLGDLHGGASTMSHPSATAPGSSPPPALSPLSFELSLDGSHPYLAERGLTQATVAKFGLGYCHHGTMRGRICIPIHDEDGSLIAYAGRWPGTPPSGVPRYKLQAGFRKSHCLFNYHRVRDAPHLVIVEGYWSVFRLDALGIAAVALMGSHSSTHQKRLLVAARAARFTLLLDGDAAGRKATLALLPRLASSKFVRAPSLPDGAQPDTMTLDALQALVRLSCL